MFEGDLGGFEPAQVLSFAGEFSAFRERADVRILEVALAYADLHPEPRVPETPPVLAGVVAGPEGLPGMEHLKVYGGEGCPEVAEFAVADLGVALGISSAAAAGVMSDALGLRHRLPLVWARVLAGEARAWRACRIARASAALPKDAAALVDKAVEKIVNRVGPDRLKKIVNAALWTADPERAQRNAEEAARARGVWIGRSDEFGTNTLFVRAATGDVVRLNATISALARALRELGDTDSAAARQAKVIGWLADPEAAINLLAAARHLAGTEFDPVPPASSAAASAAEGGSDGGDRFTRAALADRLPERLAELKARARSTARSRERLLNEARLSSPGAGRTARAADAVSTPAPGGEPGPPRDEADSASVAVEDLPAAAAPPAADLARPGGWTSAVRDLGGGRRDLYVHLSDLTLASGEGVARVEGIGPMLFSQLREVFGHDQIVVKPLIDLNDRVSVDAYETPARIRERVVLRDLYCTFPWCGRRATRSIDLDHIVPYDPGGPPGQTSTDNLTPSCRYHHRLKTHGGWKVMRLPNGGLQWTSPYGTVVIVDHTGTRYGSATRLTGVRRADDGDSVPIDRHRLSGDDLDPETEIRARSA
ncbi:HNH endonuclease signature motif containing protein [Kribbella deserti]|uniref:HNH nuclease domain-containing protein n=1 Tax=Kribbella deserti TaxID=1926257 RepID=A0ABV6QJC4_9ACTN